jgi:anti-sigma B factor antagonist
MQLTTETAGDVAVVTLHGTQLDASNSEDFKSAVAPVLKDYHKLVLDLGKMQFVDSSGCGAILSCLKNVTAAGGDLKICHVTRPVHMIFDLIRLHRLCDILATRDEAVKAFQKGG